MKKRMLLPVMLLVASITLAGCAPSEPEKAPVDAVEVELKPTDDLMMVPEGGNANEDLVSDFSSLKIFLDGHVDISSLEGIEWGSMLYRVRMPNSYDATQTDPAQWTFTLNETDAEAFRTVISQSENWNASLIEGEENSNAFVGQLKGDIEVTGILLSDGTYRFTIVEALPSGEPIDGETQVTPTEK